MRSCACVCAFVLFACVCLFAIYCVMLYGCFFLCCCVFARSSVVEHVVFLFVNSCVLLHVFVCDSLCDVM